jgi:hypothetical protein
MYYSHPYFYTLFLTKSLELGQALVRWKPQTVFAPERAGEAKTSLNPRHSPRWGDA